ncbi:hypothetical protein BH10BAC2_BH10BAC2_38420 [soil metagenome]
MEEIHILKSKGVHPSAWIWMHVQNEKNRELHYEAAREGGWVSFDGFNTESIGGYVQFLKDIRSAGLLNKVLISHDAGRYHVDETNGGADHGYTPVFKDLVSSLRNNGFTDKEIQQIFTDNPAKAFAISVRKL